MIPYGFVEQEFVDLFDIDPENYVPYFLNDGNKVMMIGEDDFNKINSIITKIQGNFFIHVENPKTYNSSIEGMRIVLHPFWYDFTIYDSLTTAEGKTSSLYRFISDGNANFSRLAFESKIDEASRIIVPNVTAENIVVDVNVAVSSESPVVSDPEFEKKVAIRKEFHRKFRDYVSNGDIFDETTKNNQIFMFGYYSDYITTDFKEILQEGLADVIDKDIYFISIANIDIKIRSLLSKMTKEEKKEFKEHCLIVVANNRTTFLKNTNDCHARCFGEIISELGIITGDNKNQEIQRIRNSSLPSEEKDRKISDIINWAKNSPYHNFDRIYKDSTTEVVWGLQQDMVVYLTPYFRTEKHKYLHSILIKELSLRFKGNISKEEIEKRELEYIKDILINNKERYVSIIVEKSSEFVEKIKKEYDEAYEKYTSLRGELIETASKLQSLKNHISSINKGEIMDKLQRETEKNYDDIMRINKVSNVCVEDNKIRVYTKNIYARDNRSHAWHDIGKFLITISLEMSKYSKNETIKITNLKHSIIGYNDTPMEAPHVFQDGYMCHGNAEVGITNAYMNNDIYQLVMLIIMFLESVNTDDPAGAMITKWPEVSEKEAMSNEESTIDKLKYDFEKTEEEEKFDNKLSELIPLHV